MFTSKAEWRSHLEDLHQTTTHWECMLCEASEVLASELEFTAHTRTHHDSLLSIERISILSEMSKRSAVLWLSGCPVCGEVSLGKDPNSFLDHLSECIHEFSLLALPWTLEQASFAFPDSFRQDITTWLRDVKEDPDDRYTSFARITHPYDDIHFDEYQVASSRAGYFDEESQSIIASEVSSRSCPLTLPGQSTSGFVGEKRETPRDFFDPDYDFDHIFAPQLPSDFVIDPKLLDVVHSENPDRNDTIGSTVAEPFTLKTGRISKRRKKPSFECVDCVPEIVFSRRTDLARHQRLKHSREDQQHFVCSAQGCFRGLAPWSFARSDKLTSHIKTTHNLDTIFSHCPIKGCTFGPCTLEVLGIHIQRAHQPHEEGGRAILNATSCKTLRCPLWRCGNHYTANKLLQHITSHDKEEVDANKPSLELLGLLVQSTPGCDVTLQVVCPICNTASTDIESFTRHLATAHLYSPQSGGLEHFETWKVHLSRKLRSDSVPTINRLPPWCSFDRAIIISESIKCPSCLFSGTEVREYGLDQDKTRAIKEHHLSLLRPEAEVVRELYPYRMQILKLWPEFVTHPVFADLDEPQHQSESGPSQTQPSFPGHVNDELEFLDETAHDFVLHPGSAHSDQLQQQSESGPSRSQSSFLGHISSDSEIPDWTTSDFNTSMRTHDELPNSPLTGHRVQSVQDSYNKTASSH
jgi:hypothetical protein